jgi:hypothetical protein
VPRNAEPTLLQRWTEWQKCWNRFDFEPFVACALHRTFYAVSERIIAHADAAVADWTASDYRGPQIDTSKAAAAISRFLAEWGAPQRPLRWFEDARSARAHIRDKSSEPPRPAYWPRMGIAPLLDAAWYVEALGRRAHHNDPWLRHYEDWQDWSITTPPAVIFDEPMRLMKRWERKENWLVAISMTTAGIESEPWLDVSAIRGADAVIGRWTPLADAFAAGLFYFRIGPEEVICIPRPSLWVADGRLHREDGPAVEWPSGERYFFLRGVEVPGWLIEEPEKISAERISAEMNIERRRCMIERVGRERYLRALGAKIVAEDQYGKLWQLPQRPGEAIRLRLQVRNGTPEPDGAYRDYFLSVPPAMRSPHQAVAWTYGLAPEQYDVIVRT